MSYQSNHPLFRSLTDEEEEEFRQHARLNNPPENVNFSVLHPVCVEEWRKRGLVSPGQPCSVPDCENKATVLVGISINNAPKARLPVCRQHLDAALEDEQVEL